MKASTICGVRIDYCSECSKEAGDTVSWIGGPDLTMPLFTPPVLINSAGKPFFVNDITENVGSTAAGPSVTIRGVTDPDSDPVVIKITGITQDEPVNGLGDGDTAPDGFGVGTGEAQLRADRSGTGNGRLYAVSFTADDGKGGTCDGKVAVGVPHDQGEGNPAIDDGQNYDSTGN